MTGGAVPGTRVALLWHMHQPWYRNPLTGRADLPWVRLHGTKDYLDMPLLAGRYEGLRVTINLVPALLAQLAETGEGRLVDEHLRIARKPVSELSADERRFVVEEFFAANPARMIARFPRYAELAALRASGGEPAFAARDLCDLEVLFHLAWVDPLLREREPFARLAAKGRDYTEGEKGALLDAGLSLLREIVPACRRLEDEGRIETSTTPYYHPILPLLIDSRTLLDALPHAVPIDPPLAYAEDARLQVRRAIEFHARVLGRTPRGVWPSEGSVSEETARLLGDEGLSWTATDEALLHRALARAGDPRPGRAWLLTPWRHEASGLAIFFRDRELSDLIGFTYQFLDPAEAARDLLGRIRARGDEGRAAGIARPVVPIILDGENCWEGYADDGRPFLEALYRGLTEAPDLGTVTFSEAVEGAVGEAGGLPVLPSLPAGSWIDGTFAIWGGHEEDRAAWSLVSWALERLRAAERGGRHEARVLDEARECLLVAEGSDWFWWYGDEHHTVHREEFDQLFRSHLHRALEVLGESPPPRLLVPVFRTKPAIGLAREPRGVVRPVVDGRDSGYFEWLDAGRIESSAPTAMHGGEQHVRRLFYGTGGGALHLRIDFRGDPGATEVRIRFLAPAAPPQTGAPGPATLGEIAVTGLGTPGGPLEAVWTGDPQPLAAAFRSVLEVSCPLDRLGPHGDSVDASLLVLRDGKTVEIWPAQGPFRMLLEPELSGDDAW